MGLTRRQCQRYGQAIAIYKRMNLAGQPAAGQSYRLSLVLGDARSVLMNADNRGVDDLDRRIVSSGECIMIRLQTPARRERTKRL